MTFLTNVIKLGTINFPIYYFVVLAIVLITLFLFWKEGTKDGFDKERLFDLFFISLLTWVVIIFLQGYLAYYYYFFEQHRIKIILYSYLLISFIYIKIFSVKLRWSVYRLLDDYSVIYSICFLILISYKALMLQEFKLYLIVIVYFLLYILLLVKKTRLLSGITFSLFLLLVAVFSQFFYYEKSNLLFYFLLLTISMFVLIVRVRINMFTKNLDKNFIDKIKELLSRKKARLEVEQKKLIEDDPYLQGGRETDNSEEMDDAILEDNAKTEIEVKKINISGIQKQVEKALGRLKTGNYGACEVCGDAIDKARLEAYPEATKCLKCSSKSDSSE